ncbi:MAG: DUF3617 family protein [Pseudomonadota bacterium]
MRTMTTGLVLAALTLTTAACSKKDETAKPATGEPAAAAAPAAAGTPTATAASVLGIPKPKLGKWRMTSEMPDVPIKMPPTEICYTAEMVANGDWASQKPPSMDCSGMRTTFVGGVIHSQGTCIGNGRKMTFDVRTTGDFSHRYTVESSTLVEPATPGLKNPMRMKIAAEWIGPCD